MDEAVRYSAELARILALPRRDWETEAELRSAQVTAAYRTPAGTMQARPVQGAMLYDLFTYGGLVAAVGVGRGKTLVSLLASALVQAERPMLVLPAALVTKTKREWNALSVAWRIPRFLRIVSYQWMGRIGAAGRVCENCRNEARAKKSCPVCEGEGRTGGELSRYRPDLIFFDEAHYVKNVKAAVTRRFHRYITACRRARLPLKVGVASGSMTAKSLHDFAHLVQWALPAGSPVPWSYVDLETWARALDALQPEQEPLAPGALLAFADARDEGTETERARLGFQRRFRQTPGVVATTDDPVRSSLIVSAFGAPGVPSAAIDQAFTELRRWTTPDGHECMDGIEVWRHAREFALGIYRRWDPWPPQWWLDARSAWGRFVREELRLRHADSAHEVAVQNPGNPLLAVWRGAERRFRPNPVTVWLDDAAARAFASWLRDGTRPGLCWTDAPEFGERVAALAGVPYYGRKGLDRRGRLVDDERGPCVLSDMSNREGRNLQCFDRNLIVSPSPSAKVNEQVIGRTHRTGQESDTVTVEYYMGCLEHWAAWQTARHRARYTEQITGQPQKILYADDCIEQPAAVGPRWTL